MIDQRRIFRLRRRMHSPGVGAGVLFLIVVCLRLYRSGLTVAPPNAAAPIGGEDSRSAVVERVVDGDTLLLETGERVRLIGVDTPETKHPDRPVELFGLEAAEFVQRRVEGRTVELRFDRERFDPYQRLLAYVYIDEECLNEEIIRAGYSKAITRFPYRSSQKIVFIAAENEARKAKRKIWERNKR
ncbi:MAG: thermonuclease family protein [Planctomycetaceae bacterium]